MYPQGATQAQTSQRLKGLGVMLRLCCWEIGKTGPALQRIGIAVARQLLAVDGPTSQDTKLRRVALLVIDTMAAAMQPDPYPRYGAIQPVLSEQLELQRLCQIVGEQAGFCVCLRRRRMEESRKFEAFLPLLR